MIDVSILYGHVDTVSWRLMAAGNAPKKSQMYIPSPPSPKTQFNDLVELSSSEYLLYTSYQWSIARSRKSRQLRLRHDESDATVSVLARRVELGFPLCPWIAGL